MLTDTLAGTLNADLSFEHFSVDDYMSCEFLFIAACSAASFLIVRLKTLGGWSDGCMSWGKVHYLMIVET